MEPSKKNNKKWIILGAVIAGIAVLIAVGPIIIAKYMAYKYMPHSKQLIKSELMIKVKGVIMRSSDDKIVYLKGENGKFYFLFGDQTGELIKNLGKTATVFGNIYEPQEGETIDGNPVRMRINVTNFGTPDLGAPINLQSSEVEKVKKKVEEKEKNKKEIASKLNKKADFDFVKGKPSKETRASSTLYIVKDAFGDTYILVGANDSMLNKEVIVIGNPSVPEQSLPVQKDEITFVVQEVYDAQYKKIK